jgi:predicted dehydrogenase
MTSHGPESWHPEPDFYFKAGGGPVFDMGPYYLTSLVHLLGPVVRVAASTHIGAPERVIGSGPRQGSRIPVETPTHAAGVLDFESGAIATVVQSFEVWAANLPRIEVYGSTGSLSVPDPNTFGGSVQVWSHDSRAWSDLPTTHVATVGRGIGIADMAHGLRLNRPGRASGDLAYHVLEVMHAFEESSRTGRHVGIASRCERPRALPLPDPSGGVCFD